MGAMAELIGCGEADLIVSISFQWCHLVTVGRFMTCRNVIIERVDVGVEPLLALDLLTAQAAQPASVC